MHDANPKGLLSTVTSPVGKTPAGAWYLGSRQRSVGNRELLNGLEGFYLIITLLTSMKSKECESPAQDPR